MSLFGSSSRKTTIFYVVLIAMASLVVGMVIASRLDLSPVSSAQTMAIPATNTAPLSGPVDATTFRNIAKNQSPMVVSIRTESRQRTQDLSEFFGGGGKDTHAPGSIGIRNVGDQGIERGTPFGCVEPRHGFAMTGSGTEPVNRFGRKCDKTTRREGARGRLDRVPIGLQNACSGLGRHCLSQACV